MPSAAVFLLPIPSGRRATPNASWITTSGLAAAAESYLGTSVMLTPEGALTPGQGLELASGSATAMKSRERRFPWVPEVAKTAAKDALLVVRAHRFDRYVSRLPLPDLAFVWQRHVPFHQAGLTLARKIGCPFVLSVHALMVREARQWGVKRPGWGRLMERLGEEPILREADLVACVSEEIAGQVLEYGIAKERILVTPNGVDCRLFHPREPNQELVEKLGLGDSFVLGWVGSFRSFHGLERVFDAIEKLQARGRELTLLLVGLGPQVQGAKNEVKTRGLQNVVFGGNFPHKQMPMMLSTMDAAIVMGPPGQHFHYSPVKLREYMAMGLPVIAGRLGELERILTNQEDALLVDPSNSEELAVTIERLMDDSDLRSRLGHRARQKIAREGSWDAVLKKILSKLGEENDEGDARSPDWG